MKATSAFRVGMGVAGILASTMTLSGCIGGPTYGTDKTAMEQLSDDLGASVSLGSSRDDANRSIKYNPRPSLVVADKQGGNLPAPEQSLANRENNPNWVESPDETRERLRKEADANAGNPNYRSPLLAGNGQAGQLTESQKWEAFRKAKQDTQSVDPAATRRGISDPPTDLRTASASTLTDLGEPESTKEKRRKKEAEAAKQSSDWWKLF